MVLAAARLGPSVGDFWYVFTQRNRKYAKGNRPSRSTGDTGRWKSVGKNTAVTYGKEKATIGYKNGLAYEVFVYEDGDSKKKRIEKTEWKMTEFVDADSNRPISSDPNFMLVSHRSSSHLMPCMPIFGTCLACLLCLMMCDVCFACSSTTGCCAR